MLALFIYAGDNRLVTVKELTLHFAECATVIANI